MGQRLVIDPVTRIEGHAKVTLVLDEHGKVADAELSVTQLRGFEKFCEGRPFTEMPSLMARICGICPLSHLVASAKACDALLAVAVPPTGVKLRRLATLAQFIQSHALSFFYLSAPDLLLGMDAEPATRNVVGLLKEHPDLARDGIRLRQFGQQAIETLTGERIHPAWVVPGGVGAPLDAERRDRMLAGIPGALSLTERALEAYRGIFGRFGDEIETFANFPSLFLSLTDAEGRLELYDGTLRLVDADGEEVAAGLDPAKYQTVLGEGVQEHSYLKLPYYKPLGYPHGLYRVGPLARMNTAKAAGTPRAQAAWEAFRAMASGAVLSSFHAHYARLIEIVFALEQFEAILRDPDILNPHVRAHAGPNTFEGVGVCEAPRGTLIHHYRINEDGLITWANLIVATAHNGLAMNQGIKQVAQRFVDGPTPSEGALNRVEAVIRTFDPCLSCSVHAVGRMPLRVTVVGPDGAILSETRRD